MRPASPVTSWGWAKAWCESLLAGSRLTHTLAQQSPAKATQPGPHASGWPPWGACRAGGDIQARGHQGCSAFLCKDPVFSTLWVWFWAKPGTWQLDKTQLFCFGSHQDSAYLGPKRAKHKSRVIGAIIEEAQSADGAPQGHLLQRL